MASLNIPAQVANGLSIIANLKDESFQELLSGLENIPLRIRQQIIFDDSGLNLETIPYDEAKAIKEAIFPLYLGRSTASVPTPTFVDDIIQSLIEGRAKDSEWAHSEEILNRFRERLNKVLNIDRLNVISKAYDVLTEHAQTYSKARVLSDIRPVFGESIQGDPPSAVIVHMLNISYFQAGERHEFIVALDTKDVQQLMETLKRAEEKDKCLQSVISSTNMTFIEVV
ncbi:MAG TPA: hypothetical protein VF544_24185 [Pyrinomonadaceae bacterium]|jgi:hypothetical protein